MPRGVKNDSLDNAFDSRYQRLALMRRQDEVHRIILVKKDGWFENITRKDIVEMKERALKRQRSSAS